MAAKEEEAIYDYERLHGNQGNAYPEAKGYNQAFMLELFGVYKRSSLFILRLQPATLRQSEDTFSLNEESIILEDGYMHEVAARFSDIDSHDTTGEARSCRRIRTTKNNLHFQVEITSSVMERAEEIQANLATQFPSFVKPMIRSNVTGGFWLSLPKLFCKLHLPSCDIKITLVDESNKEYYTKYLPERRGLSAGWRGFSISHNLEEGDILVFHLVGVCKMKVYIVRANHFSAVDAAVSLLHLQACADVVNHEHFKEGRTSPQVPEKLLRPPSQEMLCSNFDKFEESFKTCLTIFCLLSLSGNYHM
ncbi:UNVERIFIED_CONTAM: B3 domain-containing protein [Sesamum indicum]